jgi:hypothetical protein
MAESVEERLIRIETKLDSVFERKKDDDAKFVEMRNQISAIRQEIAYLKGAIALLAFVMPIIMKYFMP